MEKLFQNINWFIHSSFSEGKQKGRGEMPLSMGQGVRGQQDLWNNLLNVKFTGKLLAYFFQIKKLDLD